MGDLNEDWGQERDGIINDTLDTLRDQRDDKAQITVEGTVKVNPQLFLKGPHLVVGPISFGQLYQGRPVITYGQFGRTLQTDSVNTAEGTHYKPFLVQSYTYKVNFVNGAVDSFYIGLYALTEVPDGQIEHFIDWRASGTSSAYGEQYVEQSWDQSYDHNDPTFLVDEAPSQFDADVIETEIDELGLGEPE